MIPEIVRENYQKLIIQKSFSITKASSKKRKMHISMKKSKLPHHLFCPSCASTSPRKHIDLQKRKNPVSDFQIKSQDI